jgi:hypothetical protein
MFELQVGFSPRMRPSLGKGIYPIKTALSERRVIKLKYGVGFHHALR